MAGQRGRHGHGWNVLNAFLHSFNDLKDVKDGTGSIRWKDLKLHEFENNPYGYIHALYNARAQKVPKPPIDQWQAQLLMGLHLKYLERRIVTKTFDLIPSLNSHDTTKVKNGQVVTFRCMLQDELGPEYSTAEYVNENLISGKTEEGSTLLKDYAFQGDLMEGFSFLTEKDVYVAVSPPAENFWVSQPQEPDEDVVELSKEKKKKMEKEEKDKNFVALPNYRDLVPAIFSELGETKPMACRLKIYKTSNANMQFKTNDVVQVVGLIQLPNPESNSAGNETEEEGLTSDLVKLPILHVFSAVHLAGGNPNVLWIDAKAFPMLKASNIDVESCVYTLRELLSLCLGGDRIAATYAMMALIAKIQYPEERMGMGRNPIGKFVLNISGIPEKSEVTEWFTKIVKALTPRTLRFDFAIEKVNGAKLIPTKNMDTNILETGLLQLPDGTQLLIDETKLNEGKFEDQGCRNLITLKDLLTDQEVKYNYTYQYPTLRANFPTIILSTSATVLPYDVRVQLTYTPEMFNPNPTVNRRAKIDQMLKEKGDMLRYFLSLTQLVAKNSHEGFDGSDPQLQEDMTNYLIDRNKSDLYNNKMTHSEFAAFVASCRLWSVMHGNSNRITRESFMAIRDLERIRDGRIPKSTQ